MNREDATWLERDPEIDPEARIRSLFVDNLHRKWTFAYIREAAHVGLSDFREIQIHGATIDDQVHLLTAFSKARTLFRISEEDAASDWLWACLRATRDLRRHGAKEWKNPILIPHRQPGVIRRKKGSKNGQKSR